MADVSEDLAQGEHHLVQADFEAAYKFFERAAKADPRNAHAHWGKAEASQGIPTMKPQDVLGFYRKAMELDAKNPLYADSYASYCMDMGSFGEAETAYNKAAELDQDNAASYYMEFAINYITRAPAEFESRDITVDEKAMAIIKRKALDYALKALGITADEARQLLS
jgi:tetratricopeptide (TPR) repeat protein